MPQKLGIVGRLTSESLMVFSTDNFEQLLEKLTRIKFLMYSSSNLSNLAPMQTSPGQYQKMGRKTLISHAFKQWSGFQGFVTLDILWMESSRLPKIALHGEINESLGHLQSILSQWHSIRQKKSGAISLLKDHSLINPNGKITEKNWVRNKSWKLNIHMHYLFIYETLYVADCL